MSRPKLCFTFKAVSNDAGASEGVHFRAWGDIRPGPAKIPRSLGEGRFELLTVKPGLAVSRGVHSISENGNRDSRFVPVAQTRLILDEPALMLQTTAAGRILYEDNLRGAQGVYSPQNTLMQYSKEFDFTRSHQQGEANDIYTLVLTRGVLEDLVGDGVAQQLLTELKLRNSAALRTVASPARVSAPLLDSLRVQVSDEFRKSFVSAKVLEYLTFISDELTGDPRPPLSPRHARIVRKLHDELVCLEGKAPNVFALAEQHGLSARALNEYFKKEFEDSIYSYSKKLRLRRAHELLERSDAPVKVIAGQVGYEHVSNFILAFKSHFGYPPGKLRG